METTRQPRSANGPPVRYWRQLDQKGSQAGQPALKRDPGVFAGILSILTRLNRLAWRLPSKDNEN